MPTAQVNMSVKYSDDTDEGRRLLSKSQPKKDLHARSRGTTLRAKHLKQWKFRVDNYNRVYVYSKSLSW